MSEPEHYATFVYHGDAEPIERSPDPHAPGQRAPWGSGGGRNVCTCSKRHVPACLEIELHHVIPKGRPYLGPDIAANIRPVDPTLHSNIHFILRIFEKHGGKPPRAAFKGIRVTAALRAWLAPPLAHMGWSWPSDETVRL